MVDELAWPTQYRHRQVSRHTALYGAKGARTRQRVVGKRYALGVRGLDRDTKKAAYWLQKAADRGDGEAQFMLGMIYGEGSGIPRDLVQAHMWFSLAETSNRKKSASALRYKKQAEINRKAAEADMTPEQIKAAQALAQEWLAKHN